ncbi:MAG: aminoglycoside phosphotransferase family protein [Gammaproteobacteria bacterium]|nr:aminoglycoside phosphotransferase family protein [Gammaproteobacteria bacterium]
MSTSFAEIKAHFLAEQKANVTPRTLQDIPLSYESITPAWLTAVLQGTHPGIRVASCTFDVKDEGTSSRRRIFLHYDNADACWPRSVFCKGSPNLENRYILGMNNGIAAEVHFYNQVRPHLPIEAPVAYHANYDRKSFNSIIVMHDMIGKVEFCRIDTPMTLERGMSQMRLLARLHGEYYAKPDKFAAMQDFNTWEDYFKATVELAGFGDSCARGFIDAKDVIPPALYQRQAEIWPATLKCVAAHSHLPRTYVHSDVHLKNWYIAPGDVMGLNDWQCSCLGNWGRDVAYCISTAYTPDERRRWEQDLLKFYLEQLRVVGAPAPKFDDAWRIYRQQLFSALAWWTGTLGQPPEAPKMQPAGTSIEFIRRMTHAIDDLDALNSF